VQTESKSKTTNSRPGYLKTCPQPNAEPEPCALDGRDFHSSICDWAMHRGTCVSLRCSLRTVILCGRRCCTFGMLI
jgi:hypothetical protein